jgi:hypothetical protein
MATSTAERTLNLLVQSIESKKADWRIILDKWSLEIERGAGSKTN